MADAVSTDASTANLTEGALPEGFGLEPAELEAQRRQEFSSHLNSGSDNGQQDSGDGDKPKDSAPALKEGDFDALPDWVKTKIRDLEGDNRRYRQERRATQSTTPAGQGEPGKGADDQQSQQAVDVQAEIARAAAQARADARAEYSQQLAGQRITAALEGLGVDSPKDVVADLNLARYVADDGSLDEAAVDKAIERFKAIAPKHRRRPVGHGNSETVEATASNKQQLAEALGLA